MLNMDTPKFDPGLLYVRDEMMQTQNLGVFFDAPSWKDEDFYAFLLLQRLFGNYSAEMVHESLGDVQTQYNIMHDYCKEIPNLERYDSIFSPYSDCGIFGHYFQGEPKFDQHMSYVGGIIG